MMTHVIAMVMTAVPFCESSDLAAFLERQRRLAEEQWNADDEGLKHEEEHDESMAQHSGIEEYQYVYVDENGEYYEAEQDDEDGENENIALPKFTPKKKAMKGYKKYAGRSLLKYDSFSLEDVIMEIHELVKCPIRNESTMMPLRDDHQLNLRKIKKEIQEARKGLTISTASDPSQPAQKKSTSLSKAEQKEFDVGDRVLARYRGKTKYFHGVIRDKKKESKQFTYDIKYDNGNEEFRVASNLIIHLDVVSDKKTTNSPEKEKRGGRVLSRQSFKEKQEERRKKKEEEYQALLEIEKDPGRTLDSDCESQICMACKSVVDEFADKVFKNIDNANVEYLYDVIEYQQPLCESPQIRQRYTPVVHNICEKLTDEETGFRDMFTRPFEDDFDWKNVKSRETLLPKKEQICVSSGLCDSVAFEFEVAPDQDWGSDQCFVCHALLDDLEDKVSVQQKVTEGSAIGLVKSGCDNLKLPESLASECKMMTEGKLLDDIGWILKLFKESLERKEKAHRNFADSACEEISMCEKWIDPKAEKEPEIEMVYS